ncbi:MAG: hypothetical protein WD894_19870 [Pirellulales bacterium]
MVKNRPSARSLENRGLVKFGRRPTLPGFSNGDELSGDADFRYIFRRNLPIIRRRQGRSIVGIGQLDA